MFRKQRSSRAKVAAAGVDARRAPRHETNLVSCEIGEVADLSATGMRINCQTRPPVRIGQVIPIRLKSQQQRIDVSALIVWIKRSGLRRCTVGLKFVNISTSLSAAIESLAMFGFVDLEAAAAAKKKVHGGRNAPIQATASLPDYYAILGLNTDATMDHIHQAFRKLAVKYHPDVTKDPEGPRKFLQINEAYDMLSDPEARAAYDMRMVA